MKKIIFFGIFLALCVSSTMAQKSKSWTDWSKKEAEHTLNDSAWGKAQEDTDLSEMTYSPTAPTSAITSTASSGNASRDLTNRGRDESGAKNEALSLRFRVRFFTAKPIREAFARMIVLQQASSDEQRLKLLADKMQGWIDEDLGDIIVIAVAVESMDRRMSGPIEQALRSATTETLKTTCYFERNDGKRVQLVQYEQPTADQTGAKFVFARTLDGQPFITNATESVRFVAEIGDKVKINRRFKVSEMMYNGKLEY
jgi:hypothetical protein